MGLRKAKPSLVFFGNERLATGVTTTAPTLQALIKAGYNVKAVVSSYERGTSRKARHLEIQEVANRHTIPVLLPEKPADIIKQLHGYGAKIAVLVAYGRIIPQSVIDIFPRGIINIHPSLLPLHRGPMPIESVILNGESKTGVSIMQLVKSMDTGPVFGQSEIELNGGETKQQLADKLLDTGSKMVIKLLPSILKDKQAAERQDESVATYDKMIKKEDGKIDWEKPAEQLAREVRAYAGWPGSYTVIATKDVIITDAGIAAYDIHGPNVKPGYAFPTPSLVNGLLEEMGYIGVAAGEGVLLIERLKPAGKKDMSAKEFLAGYGKNL